MKFTAAILSDYFKLTDLQKSQFEKLGPLYEDWNSKINVISRKDMDNFYIHHVLHSLSIAKVISFKPKTRILDLGTGGGFPGIPLAIMFPECEFVLVDSIGKKITVVNAVAEALDLKNVKGIHSRAEQIPGKFEFIVTRAVASYSDLVYWTRNKYSEKEFNAIPNGLLCLKGGDLRTEIREAKIKPITDEIISFFNFEHFKEKVVSYLPL